MNIAINSLPLSRQGSGVLGLISNKSCDNSEVARPKGLPGEVVSVFFVPLPACPVPLRFRACR